MTNETFIPRQVAVEPEVTQDMPRGAAPIAAPRMTGANPDQMVQVSMATEVMTRPAFIDLLKSCATFDLYARGLKAITTDEECEAARVVFTEMKGALKTAEDIRTEAILFPRKFTDAVNQLFRENIRKPIEAAKGTVQRVIDTYLDKREAEAKAAREAAEAAAAAGPTGVTDLDGGPQHVLPPDVIPASTIVRTEAGSTYRRETTTITVTDAVKLLKAIVSDSKTNDIFTADIVEIKISKLRELAADNPRRKSWPGFVVEKVKRSI